MGKDKCGYLSSVPRNRKQSNALLTNKCPNCKGVVRLYVPKEKDKTPALFCIKEGCKGALWFNDKGGVSAPSASNGNGKTSGSSGGNGDAQETGEPCIKCGKLTVKRSFKKKDGKQGHFWGCSEWKKSGGCDAPPIWIN